MDGEQVSQTWTCTNCDEQHSGAFDACWNCGTDVSGLPDASFRTELDRELVVDAHVDDCDSFSHRLPGITYYSIPLFSLLFPIVVMQWTALGSTGGSAANSSLNASAIVVYLAGVLLIVLPTLAIAMRAAFYSLMHRHRLPAIHRNVRLLVEAFRLPDPIARERPWFKPVYYASFLLYLIGPIVTNFL